MLVHSPSCTLVVVLGVLVVVQEAACNHAAALGFTQDGFACTPIMHQQSLVWVVTRMHIEMDSYPTWSVPGTHYCTVITGTKLYSITMHHNSG